VLDAAHFQDASQGIGVRPTYWKPYVETTPGEAVAAEAGQVVRGADGRFEREPIPSRAKSGWLRNAITDIDLGGMLFHPTYAVTFDEPAA
jgi:hypothetical protein